MGSQRPLPGMAEFHDFGFESKPFVKASGLRKFYMQIGIRLADIERSEDHQRLMGEFAERAVRWLGEQAVDIQWHTLRFEVVTMGEEFGEDTGHQAWRWSVWAS